jgi:hypothetical protein
MSIPMILLPLFVQVLLTFVLAFWMAALRTAPLRRGEISPDDIALRQSNWPKKTTQVGNCFLNQCETPVLFYVLTVLAIITKQADLLFVLLSWVFVVLRLGHAFVHVTDNNLVRRGALFGAATLVLAIMWLIFIIRILLLGVP